MRRSISQCGSLSGTGAPRATRAWGTPCSAACRALRPPGPGGAAGGGRGALPPLDVTLDTPEWLMARWKRTYGDATARAIAAVHGEEPPLDLTVTHDANGWAARLRGRVVAT